MRAFEETLDSGWFIGGPAVEEFEADFAQYVGVEHCVALGNGLDAIRIGLEAAGVRAGDEVIVPGFTFYATWLAVLQVGATPVPVDVDENGSIDVAATEAAVSARTRAVLPVHLFGIPADMVTLAALAQRHGLLLIEDGAQAHGAWSAGRRVGAIGDVGAFSFYPTKNLGALGDAGALTTNAYDIAEIARRRRSYGQGASKYDHVDTGWNSRMDPIQARVLRDGLRALDAGNERRRVIASAYRDALGDAAGALIGGTDIAGSVWHHCVVRVTDRERFVATMTDAGIGSDIHYPYYFGSVPALRERLTDVPELPRSRMLAASVVSLPNGTWLDDDDLGRVCDVLRSIPPEQYLPMK